MAALFLYAIFLFWWRNLFALLCQAWWRLTSFIFVSLHRVCRLTQASMTIWCTANGLAGGVPSSVVVSSPSQPAEDHAAAAGAPTRAVNHEISGRFPQSCPNLPWIGPNSEQALRVKHVPCLHSPRQNHTKLRVSQQPGYRVDPGKEAGNAAANVPGPLPTASDQDLRREPWVTCEIHSKIHSSTCTRAPSPSVLASRRQDQIENGPGGPTSCGLNPSPLSTAPRRMPWP